MLSTLHSTLLYLCTVNLDQIVDFVRLLSSSRVIRDKLKAIPQTAERINRAKQRYASPDLHQNLEYAAEDRQCHFIAKYGWIGTHSLLVGTIKSGDVDAVKGISIVEADVSTYTQCFAASYSGNMAMVEYVLSLIPDDELAICDVCMALAKGATHREDVAFIRTMLTYLKERYTGHTSCTCPYYGVLHGAVEKDDVSLLTWIFETINEDRATLTMVDSWLTGQIRSRAIQAVFLKYCPLSHVDHEQVFAWIIMGEIDQHRDEIAAWIKKASPSNCHYRLLGQVMMTEDIEAIDATIALIPRPNKRRISNRALLTSKPVVIKRYVRRTDARSYQYNNPVAFVTVLDHFNFRITEAFIGKTFTLHENISCAFHLATRNYSIFASATKERRQRDWITKVLDYLRPAQPRVKRRKYTK